MTSIAVAWISRNRMPGLTIAKAASAASSTASYTRRCVGPKTPLIGRVLVMSAV